MNQLSLEEAGERLKRMRRELADAEAAFRTQYDEARRSTEDQLRATRDKLAEIEQNSKAQLDALDGAGVTPEEANEVRREIGDSIAMLNTQYAVNEARFQAVLASAAEIIESR